MLQSFQKYYGGFLLIFSLLLAILSCDKVEYPIPDVYVSFTVNLNIVNDLNAPGSSVYFPNVGFGGVIIYCEEPGRWNAFDAACTYEASRTCIVRNDGVLADCPCCESQFVLLSGAYPVKSPATIPLKQYHVSMMNNYTLRVYN
jgi:Rieske Fe-S protein